MSTQALTTSDGAILTLLIDDTGTGVLIIEDAAGDFSVFIVRGADLDAIVEHLTAAALEGPSYDTRLRVAARSLPGVQLPTGGQPRTSRSPRRRLGALKHAS